MRILLAPMEGLLDWPMRDVVTAIGGMDLCVTEFVRISGSVLPNRMFHRVAPELLNGSRTQSGVPVRVQLLGSDPDYMALNAQRLAELKPAAIDLNFGCPAKKVNRHHGGASLLRDPELLHRVVASVRRAVPADMAVTAKMRLGYEDKTLAIDCARAIESGGAAELVVHARTKTEGYRPPAHWEWIGRIADAIEIPVVANGEIWTPADYARCREISGVSDVMLGRGMVANPFLAHSLRGNADPSGSWEKLAPSMRRYWDLVGEHKTAGHRNGRMKQWLNYLRRHFVEAEALFAETKAVNCPDRLEKLLFPT
jgi:tRNA-dihydrouridine synthase C